jgi:hypothetical protein
MKKETRVRLRTNNRLRRQALGLLREGCKESKRDSKYSKILERVVSRKNKEIQAKMVGLIKRVLRFETKWLAKVRHEIYFKYL